MLWSLELFFSLDFGYEFSTLLLGKTVDIFSRLCIGVPIGFASFSYIFYSTFSKKLIIPENGLETLIFVAFSSVLIKFFNLFLIKKQKIKLNPIKIVSIITTTLIIVAISDIFYNNHSKSNFKDFPEIYFHKTIVKSFLEGGNTNITKLQTKNNTLFLNETFPFLPEYYTAILIGTGECSEKTAFLVPFFFLTISTVAGFYCMSYEITNSHLAAGISLFLFINFGGVNLKEKKQNETNIWPQTVTQMIVQHISSFYAFPCVFWAVFLLIKSKNNSFRETLTAGILVCILSQIQIQSYLGTFIWSFLYVSLLFVFKKEKFFQMINIFIYFVVAFGIPVSQKLPLISYSSTLNKYQIISSWNDFNFSKLFSFWWHNLGLFIFFATFFVWKVVTRDTLLMYIPSCIIFIMFNMVKIQKNSIDNIKFLYSGWVTISCPLVALVLSKLITTPKRILYSALCTFLFVGFLFSMSISGILSFGRVFTSESAPFNDLDYYNWIKENTLPTDVFSFYPNKFNSFIDIGRLYFSVYTNSTFLLSSGEISEVEDNDYANKISRCKYIDYIINDISNNLIFRPPKDDLINWKIVYKDKNCIIWGKV